MDSSRSDRREPFRILLIEHDPIDVKLVTSMLDTVKSLLNCSVTHVPRLDAALERHGREPHDVALLDLALPDAPGLEAIDRFRHGAPGVPVIALADSSQGCTPMLAAQRGRPTSSSKTTSTPTSSSAPSVTPPSAAARRRPSSARPTASIATRRRSSTWRDWTTPTWS